MSKYFRKKKSLERETRIAKERVAILKERIEREPESAFAKSYTKTLLKISKKYRIRLPAGFLSRLCRDCNNYRVLGKTAKIRIFKGKRIVICNCGRKEKA